LNGFSFGPGAKERETIQVDTMVYRVLYHVMEKTKKKRRNEPNLLAYYVKYSVFV